MSPKITASIAPHLGPEPPLFPLGSGLVGGALGGACKGSVGERPVLTGRPRQEDLDSGLSGVLPMGSRLPATHV